MTMTRALLIALTLTLTACSGSGRDDTAPDTTTAETASTTEGTELDANAWLDEVHAPTIDRIAQVNRRLTDRIEQANDDEVDQITTAFCTEMRGTIKQAQSELPPPSAPAAELWNTALDGFLEAHDGEGCFWELEHRADGLGQAMIDLLAVEDLLTN